MIATAIANIGANKMQLIILSSIDLSSDPFSQSGKRKEPVRAL